MIIIIIIVHMTIIFVYLAVELPRCAGRTQRGTASLRVKPQLTAARRLCGCANSSCCGGAAAGAACYFRRRGSPSSAAVVTAAAAAAGLLRAPLR